MVELQVKNGAAWLTLARPEALNALDAETVRSFKAHLKDLRRRKDVRVIITQGAGRSFCAGSDLRELGPLSPAEATAQERQTAKCFSRLDEMPQPTIALLHGHVLGGGLGLAIYHDFRIAADDAVLGLPEVELGWTPPWAVGRLVDLIGAAKARWLLLTAERVTGAKAASLGLVDEAVKAGDLMAYGEQLAKKFAAMPPEGLKRTKELLRQMSPLREASWDAAAAEAFQACYAEPAARQRVADFLARKKK